MRVPSKDSPGVFQIAGISDPTRAKYLKMMAYGPPGVGKTSLFGSAVDIPALRDVLLVSAEGGSLVLEDNDRIQHPELIDEVRVTQIEQLQKIYEFLVAHCKMRDAGNEDGLRGLQNMVFNTPGDKDARLRKYQCLIIDSLTDIEYYNLSKILGFDAVSGSLGIGDETAIADFPAFRKNNNIMQRLVRQIRDLPIHVFIVCAQAYVTDELKRKAFMPSLTGKLTGQVQGFMDIVGYYTPTLDTQKNVTVRRLYVQPSQFGIQYDAKCRKASFKQPFVDNPTMLSLFTDLGMLEKKPA